MANSSVLVNVIGSITCHPKILNIRITPKSCIENLFISSRRVPFEKFPTSLISRNYSSVSRNAAGRSSCRHSWTISAIDDDVFNHSPSTLPSRTSPWLMLPPAFDQDNNMVYKFYSLKDDKVLSINKRVLDDDDDDEPADESEIVGSSHGWLALYNRPTSDLFLSNPLSRRHIKLPPVPISQLEHISESDDVTIILSSPPDDDDSCRAVMIFGTAHAYLAYCCCPGRSTQWTLASTQDHDPDYQVLSCVYSSTQKLFFCTNQEYDLQVLDVADPSSPKCFPIDRPDRDQENFPWYAWSGDDWLVKEFLCSHVKYLVVNADDDLLLLVTRTVLEEMYPDGSSGFKTITVKDALIGGHYRDANGLNYPYKTIDFNVHKYDPDQKAFKYMDRDLDGLAIFVGKNHSFAIRASSDFPELKPDSIYFTNKMLYKSYSSDDDLHGHDIGIFNYKDRTLSPCYYPCDAQSIKRIDPPPLWFTPSYI